MTLSAREKKWLLALPTLLFIILYFFYGFLPLQNNLDKTRQRQRALGTPDILRTRIAEADATHAEALLRHQELLAETEDGHGAPHPLLASDTSASKRFHTLVQQMDRASIRLISADQNPDARSADSGLPLPETTTYWTLRLNGSYPGMFQFLDYLVADQSAIPDTLLMNPVEPGRLMEWTLGLWL